MEKASNKIIAITATIVSVLLAINVIDVGLDKIASGTPLKEIAIAGLIFTVLLIMTVFSIIFAVNYFKSQEETETRGLTAS